MGHHVTCNSCCDIQYPSTRVKYYMFQQALGSRKRRTQERNSINSRWATKDPRYHSVYSIVCVQVNNSKNFGVGRKALKPKQRGLSRPGFQCSIAVL